MEERGRTKLTHPTFDPRSPSPPLLFMEERAGERRKIKKMRRVKFYGATLPF
jgi:hypothetical protein